MAERPTCPRCGSELPAPASRGPCPRCLTREGADGEARGSTDAGAPAAMPTASVEPGGPGVLETLAATVGPLPRVSLRDADTRTEPPVHRPAADGMPAPTDRPARLRLLGEIARGGMGAVLRGRDEDLGRDLAVKVLLERHRDNPELIRRFVEEAQIAGQLQHPGVAPIYELGTLADRRPFFTMKLIKGHTLADLLRDRGEPDRDRPRLLGIFEQVGQTVAYAHARGVIHRDLKPSNVMVGGFGEVQVMDWGLAKVLRRAGATDEAGADGRPEQETVIATARGVEADSDLSRAGSVLGTPAYMAPEQARGEVERVDERADVFALGSILCEILTGGPAFSGRNAGEIQRRAARGDTPDALSRLDACGADAELIGLARDCLAVEPEDRPRDARAVSDRLTAYLRGVQERLRAAELARAAAAARAEEAQARAAVERSRRRRTVALAAVILVSATLGGVAITYTVQERRSRLALADRIGGEVTGLLAVARTRPEDPDLWRAALAPVRQLDTTALPTSARTWLDGLRRQAQAGLDAAEADRPLLTALDRARDLEAQLTLVNASPWEARPDRSGAETVYSQAFRQAGLDLDGAPVSEVAAALRARPSPLARAAVAALDDWALALLADRTSDRRRRRLLEIARAVDPDPFRDRVRAALLAPVDPPTSAARLRALAADPEAAELPPSSALMLARALRRLGAIEAAADLLRTAAVRHPDDFWLNYSLAEVLMLRVPPARDEAIAYYRAARALRPRTGVELARLLRLSGRDGEATAVLVDLSDRRWQSDWRPLMNLCLNHSQGMVPPAVIERHVARGREAVRLYPAVPSAHAMLGVALLAGGALDEAIDELREAIRRVRPEVENSKGSDIIVTFDPRDELGISPEAPLAPLLHPVYSFNFRMLLSVALRERGDFEAALAVLGEEPRFRTWPGRLKEFFLEAERMAALADRLPAALEGTTPDGDARDLLTLARMARILDHHAASARLSARAFESDPTIADDPREFHRYNAACDAALAAAGRGRDRPPPDEAGRAALRRQALAWLRAELAAWAGRSRTDAEAADRTLKHWTLDPDLAGVRDPDALAALPESERADWQAFWAEVERLPEEAAWADGTPPGGSPSAYP